METTVINATEYRELPLALLNESKTNPRRVFDDVSLRELAASIRSQGVLSPLLVRPLTENGFEIVAGARRYRAAQMAEAVTVPVRIKQMSDAEVLEAQLVENLIRAEIHPMEEAEGFARLLALEEPKYSIEQIAAKVGKQPSFVASRLKLVDLVPAAVDAFYANEIGVGHALLLAKLPADQQEQALSACFKEAYNSERATPTRILLPVRNLQFWIETNVLLILKDAPFDKRDAQLVPTAGSCADCPKRTGHNKLLFGDDLGKQGDQCTDPRCYNAKLAAHVAKAVAAKPNLVQISTAYGGQKEGSPVLPRNKYTAIRDDKPTKEGRCPAPGVQGVQVRYRCHHHRRQRHRHHSQGVRESRLPHSPRQQATARDGCGIQGRAGEAPPRRGHRPGDRPSRPESNQRRGSRPADEARPAFCHRAPCRRLGRAPSGDHLSASRHRQGQRQPETPRPNCSRPFFAKPTRAPSAGYWWQSPSCKRRTVPTNPRKPCAKPPSSTRWTWPRSRRKVKQEFAAKEKAQTEKKAAPKPPTKAPSKPIKKAAA